MREAIKRPRPYSYVDCSKNTSQITKLIEHYTEQPGFLVIDGAGHRPHLALWLTRSMGLVLIPVTNSAENVRCALQDLARFDNERVRVIVNGWPANRLVRLVMQGYVEALPQHRLAGRLSEIGSMRVFLEDAEWRIPPGKVINQARRLFRLVEKRLDQPACEGSETVATEAFDHASRYSFR